MITAAVSSAGSPLASLRASELGAEPSRSLAPPSPPVSLARRPRLSLIMPAPFRLNTSPRASPRLPQMSTYKAPGAAKAEGEAPQMHRIRITLTSKNVANLEKGA